MGARDSSWVLQALLFRDDRGSTLRWRQRCYWLAVVCHGPVFCGFLGLHLSTPSRVSGSPAQPQKLFPALLCSISAQVFPPLEQGRLTVGHLPAVIDEHQWIADPCLLVAVKPADPEPVSVDVPALAHGNACQHLCTSRVAAKRSSSGASCWGSQARHPKDRSLGPSRQCALMPMTLCLEGTKLSASRSEAFMRDDGPTEQIQEAD